MIEQVLTANKSSAAFPAVSLVIFMLFFAGVLYWALRADKKYIEKMQNLPLQGADNELSEGTNDEV